MLEKKHGLPFFFKLMFCAWYMGLLSSIYWVNSEFAKRDRYQYTNPSKTTVIGKDYYYMGAHGLSSTVLYFFLYKSGLSLLILPALAADMYIWGPYFSNGPLTGVAFGLIL